MPVFKKWSDCFNAPAFFPRESSLYGQIPKLEELMYSIQIVPCDSDPTLPDTDGDGLNDNDDDGTIVAILTICSVPISKYNSSGHAFVSIKNVSNGDIQGFPFVLPDNKELSIGTWENKTNSNDGVHYNMEIREIHNKPAEYVNRVSLSMYIDATQLSTIINYVEDNNYWSLANNCSWFAAGLWNSVSVDRKVSAGFTSVTGIAVSINMPSILCYSIEQYSEYESDRDFEYDRSVVQNYGYWDGSKLIGIV